MRIGMLLDKPFPPDPRVANEARSLIRAGHAVYLFCLNLGQEAAEEDWQGIHVVRYPMSRAFRKKASALILSLPFYRHWFRRRLPAFLNRFAISALHVHDLPLVGEGLRAARAAGIPLIADLHESYPEALRLYAWARRWPAPWLVQPRRWDAYERRVIGQVDRVVTVIEEGRDRLVRIGIDARKIAVVANTVNVEEFLGFARDQALIERLEQRFTVSYLGIFERYRSLETLIDAAAVLGNRIPKLQIVLVGSGAIEPGLRAYAARRGVSQRVAFEGWQPFERFPSYILGSRVCVIPRDRNPQSETTIPHKLFHYMLLERPALASNCAPMVRILRETQAGLVYPSGNAEALAEALLKLQDAQLRARLGAAGKRAVLGKFNWEQSARALLALYDGLASRTPRSRT